MADDVKFEIIEAHWDEAKEMAKQAIRRGLEAVGIAAVTDVVKEISRPKKHGDGSVRPNVVTGLLRNRITYAVDGNETAIKSYKADKGDGKGEYDGKAPEEGEGLASVSVGTNVEYAPNVEYGTSRSKAYPFLKKTIQKNLDRYKEIFEHYGSVD